ncbi:response regulator [Comamonas sp.]
MSSITRNKRFAIPGPVLLVFIAAALSSLIIAVVNVRSSSVRADAVDAIQHMTTAMRQLNELQSSVKDAESAQRGYLLTHDEAYLEPYYRAAENLDVQLEGLIEDNADSATRDQLAAQISAFARRKFATMQESIDLLQAGKANEAVSVMRLDRGKSDMDRLNTWIRDLSGLQNVELERRQALWVQAASASNLYSWGGSITLLLLVMITALMTAREYQRKLTQTWVSTGLSGLSQALQGDHTLEQLGKNALDYLAQYLDAKVGAGYVVDPMHGRYQLFGGYALPSEGLHPQVTPGEGLTGQALSTLKIVKVQDLQTSHWQIQSSTGQTSPAELLIVPAVENDKAYAVFELGFLRPTSEAESELLESASSILAVAVRSAIDRTELEKLLEETRLQSEELQMQQEKLRSSNEELEQQSQALQNSQAQMEQQQHELECSNAHLEEQTQKLEHQREQLLRVQDALTDKARELEMASQYKSEFLANMSHELRTPLNSTLILAKLLTENKTGNLSSEQIKYAQTIYDAGNDLLSLINDILDLSKIEAGQATITVEPVNIATSMQSLIEPLRPLAQQKGLDLRCQIDADVPMRMQTDGLRLGQILKNLLSNAIKFTHQGSVTLHVSMEGPKMIAFAVRDTGIGIPESQLQMIFEAFHQADGSTHRKYGGTGLGLSIARNLAKLLGGNISVHSVPDSGSVFTFRTTVDQALPELIQKHPPAVPAPTPAIAIQNTQTVATPQIATTKEATPLPQRTVKNGRHILIVEDDDQFAQILIELCQEKGFSSEVVGDAAQALDAAVQSRPQAIVLDIHLPDFSGLGVLDLLKRNPVTRHIPVHIVSATDYTQEALGRGAIGYALKPVDREELVCALEKLEAKFTQNIHRVLLIEDDERQQNSIRSLLSSISVEIECADTAAMALEQLGRFTYDCVIMDLNLPDMSGFELLEQMSEHDGISFPPVIVYTGRVLSRDEEMQLRRFSNSIIIKDARSPERLLDEVTLFLHQVEEELSPEHKKMLVEARSRDAALEGKTVLVVEDDVRNIFALNSILEPTGMQVEIARNGLEALELLKQKENAIDLVLMDIMMPEMDGYTAMREIRHNPQWRRLPIIALTAKAMKDDQEKCLAAGANDYIAKPLDVEKLLSLIRVWMPS